ncbi:MAG TPA: GGDEF domain-containing protein, partial [Gammaproteobacteria bacterium]|nr:GGDEF domain-containing protein [Gammaproteobacteria bacterium]
PLVSRGEELTLLLLGRSEGTFSDRDVEIVTAFTHQALNALDNARLFAEVQNLGTTDSLTRVHNRRYFFEQAELEFSRSKRYERDLALLLLDADHFRDVNEYYGQDVGDRVMKLMAGICRQSLRHFDIIGRYSGESFIVMLPETPVNVAADVADRLRKNIGELSIETHRGELRLTISVGVAVNNFGSNREGAVDDLSSLINKADMALYEAKRSGRNRVVVS